MTFSKPQMLTSLMLASLLAPQAAFPRDVEVCANLYRRLNSTPQIIGTSSNVRRYAQDLSALNADIRQLRIDMRRQGCGSGSIVALGAPSDGDDECGYMQDTLQRLEDEQATQQYPLATAAIGRARRDLVGDPLQQLHANRPRYPDGP